MVVKTTFTRYDTVTIEMQQYEVTDSVCIRLVSWDAGYPEVFATITKCFPNAEIPSANYAYVDVNNCPWAMDFINEFNLGRDTGIKKDTLWCVYPLVDFNLDECEKYA